MDDGATAVTDADFDARIRKQARQVYVRATVTAVALTLLAFAIPMRG